ncbi:hypothetical protein AGMMS50267_17600 [Spirochaetia bacterium]|nr:hypothetical protein AGMMS50267_17600 [Spirochaetia bacterium]
MEKAKVDDLSKVFTELTDEKQERILAMSKSLLKAQRWSRALIDIEGAVRNLPIEEKPCKLTLT